MILEFNMTFFDTKTQRELHDEREYRGYQFADFFKDDGYDKAQRSDSAEEADNILGQTYKGADTDGIGLRWTVTQRADE